MCHAAGATHRCHRRLAPGAVLCLSLLGSVPPAPIMTLLRRCVDSYALSMLSTALLHSPRKETSPFL